MRVVYVVAAAVGVGAIWYLMRPKTPTTVAPSSSVPTAPNTTNRYTGPAFHGKPPKIVVGPSSGPATEGASGRSHF